MNLDLYENVRWLIDAVARGLHARSGEGIDEVLSRLAEQALDQSAFREPEPNSLPVLRHLPECIGEVMLFDADLAAAIAAVEDALEWRQSQSYTDAVLGESFTANYGWAEIIGPGGFFHGDDYKLGLLMLGPHRHYKDHYHPAPELYWTLTGPSDWKRGAGGFEAKAAGEVIWHPPLRMHATITQDKPLLALWCWTRDTTTPAKLA